MQIDLPIEDRPGDLDHHGPIFILGSPRSGTTFLSDCIGSIKQVEVFVGVLAPPRLMHHIGYFSGRGEETQFLVDIARDIFWQSFWRRRMFGSERVARAVTERTIRPLFDRSLDGHFFCYKEPFLCFAFEQFFTSFPNAKFIHIIRDGSDVADSLDRSYSNALSDSILKSSELAHSKNSEIGIFRTLGKWCIPWWVAEGQEMQFVESDKFMRLLWMWKEMVSTVCEASDRLAAESSGRYLEIRYESVVQEPQLNAERILDFLGFQPSGALLQSLKKGYGSSVGISKQRKNRDCEVPSAEIKDFLQSMGY